MRAAGEGDAGGAEPASSGRAEGAPSGGEPASGTRAGEVLRVAFRLGLTSFGGPIAHLGYFHREYVVRRRWLDEATFAELVALCQLLPGPASSQLGIAIGSRRAGLAGGLAAWLGFTLPSAFLLGALGLASSSLDLAGAGWAHGLKLVAVAVVALAVVTMARTLAPDGPRRALALAAALVVLLLPGALTQVGLIVAGAALGLALATLRRRTAERESWVGATGVAPSQVVPSSGTPPGGVTPRVAVVALASVALLLIALPVLAAAAAGSPVARPLGLVDAFYRAGALVFGGGHVVLPLLESGVVAPGFVARDAFAAGYGAAQAVPGPLFTIASYLGAVAGSAPGAAPAGLGGATGVVGGIVGAVVATVAIFLPGALLVIGILPFWDRIRASARARAAFRGANVVVVGILGAALAGPVVGSAIRVPLDLALGALAVGLLATGRIPVVAVVVGAALVGQAVAS